MNTASQLSQTISSPGTIFSSPLSRYAHTRYFSNALRLIREDAEFLTRHTALPPSRIVAIETGGCPHAAVREDISTNLHALQSLHATFSTDLLLIESGGDNLAANYSRELADFIIYVIDVAGGDKVPRKGGPGITGSDLLVVNKVCWLLRNREGTEVFGTRAKRLGGDVDRSR